jgi:hypothetical protein
MAIECGGPQTIAKLVNITRFIIPITIVNGVYKPTNTTGGAPHCRFNMNLSMKNEKNW